MNTLILKIDKALGELVSLTGALGSLAMLHAKYGSPVLVKNSWEIPARV